MLSIGALKRKLADLPDDARCHGYEGEVTGLSVMHADGRFWFIRADEDLKSDDDLPREPAGGVGRHERPAFDRCVALCQHCHAPIGEHSCFVMQDGKYWHRECANWIGTEKQKRAQPL